MDLEFEPWQQFILRVLLLVLGAGVMVVAYFLVHDKTTAQNVGLIGVLLIIATSYFHERLEKNYNFAYLVIGILVAVALGLLGFLFPANPNADNIQLAAVLVFIYTFTRLFW